MSTTSIVNYTNPANFTFDAAKIEVNGAHAQLIAAEPLPAQIFTEDFDSDTGFTYNASVTAISAGQLSQIDQRPPNALSYVNYSSGFNLNWGNGTLSATPTGSPVLTGGKLDLTAGSGTYMSYDAVNNAQIGNVGTVRFKYTPNYTGSPANNQAIWQISEGATLPNRLFIRHDTSGNILIRAEDSTGAVIFSTNLGIFSPVAAQEYEFELNLDVTTGGTRFFIDGVQLGSTLGATDTRTATQTVMRLGADYTGGANNPNFLIDQIMIFSTVQHTANYTPASYDVPTVYVEDVIIVPNFVYGGLGNLQSFDNFSAASSGSPRFTLNGNWWNGSSVAASNGTYAEANDAATLATNLPQFNPTATSTLRIFTFSSNTQIAITNVDLTYTGSQYWTDNPSIITNGAFGMEELFSFSSAVVTFSVNAVKFILVRNTIPFWWNGVAWVISNNTYTQSNTAEEINANAATFDLAAGHQIQIQAFLHSADGSSTPFLQMITLVYDFYAPFSPAPTCLVYGFVTNLSGQPVKNAKVRVFTNGNLFIPIGSTSAVQESIHFTPENGYWELPIVISDTPVTIAYYFFENSKLETVQYDNRIIPDLPTVSVNELAIAP